jgi:two-component system chemotaxis response regulator CheB
MSVDPRQSPRREPLRVVIVNDSPTMRASIRAALALSPDVVIAAEVGDGARAADVVERTRPSVVLMDVVMPNLDGYGATREIMARAPTPIVMMSAVVDPRASEVIFAALEAGALCVAEAPPAPSDPEYVFRSRTARRAHRRARPSRRPRLPARTTRRRSRPSGWWRRRAVPAPSRASWRPSPSASCRPC